LIEVLVVVWLIAILAAVLVSAMAMLRRPISAPRITCVSHLKEIGLSFRIWSNDHGDHFPWSIAHTGTLEFATSREVWRHFQIASNELNRPKILVCPSDRERMQAK